MVAIAEWEKGGVGCYTSSLFSFFRGIIRQPPQDFCELLGHRHFVIRGDKPLACCVGEIYFFPRGTVVRDAADYPGATYFTYTSL
ncbi:MAG TPA: hypothetical protein VLJ17_08100 [Xanthobacteraceae bacterium]|nr:hypothetical protein [Xanthobacteraceae bacterium]